MKRLDGPNRTWTMRRDSRIAKLYVSLYVDRENPKEVEKALSRLTFCRLAWGLIFSPIMAIGLLVFWPLAKLADRFAAQETPLTPEEKAAAQERRAKKQARKVKRSERIDRFMVALDKLSAWWQEHPKVGRAIRKSAKGFGIALVVAAVLGFVAYLVWVGVEHTSTFLWTLLGFACAAVGSTLLAVVGMLLSHFGWAAAIGRGGWRAMCAVGRGFRTVYRFIVDLDHAVKYRTCPKIVVMD